MEPEAPQLAPVAEPHESFHFNKWLSNSSSIRGWGGSAPLSLRLGRRSLQQGGQALSHIPEALVNVLKLGQQPHRIFTVQASRPLMTEPDPTSRKCGRGRQSDIAAIDLGRPPADLSDAEGTRARTGLGGLRTGHLDLAALRVWRG
jgi:hypothetical protein